MYRYWFCAGKHVKSSTVSLFIITFYAKKRVYTSDIKVLPYNPIFFFNTRKDNVETIICTVGHFLLHTPISLRIIYTLKRWLYTHKKNISSLFSTCTTIFFFNTIKKTNWKAPSAQFNISCYTPLTVFILFTHECSWLFTHQKGIHWLHSKDWFRAVLTKNTAHEQLCSSSLLYTSWWNSSLPKNETFWKIRMNVLESYVYASPSDARFTLTIYC